MSVEHVDRRVLGAVRFVDAVTGADVDAPLRVDAAGVRWIRNRSGWWVAASAPGLEAHTLAFEAPPSAPPLGSVATELTVEDPTGRYLRRRAALALPRSADPRKAATPDSLFRPREVALFRAPAAAVAAGWAVVRASVSRGGAPLADALLRVVRKGDAQQVMGRGMTDARGEALVAVAGIPVTTWDEEGQGGVLATEADARLEVLWKAPTGPPDPDELAALKKPLGGADVKLASGRLVTVAIVVS